MSAVGQPLRHVTGMWTVSAVGEHRRPACALRHDAHGWCHDRNGREQAQGPGDNGTEDSGRAVTPSVVLVTHRLCTYRFWMCEFVCLPKLAYYLEIKSCGTFVVNCGHAQKGENLGLPRCLWCLRLAPSAHPGFWGASLPRVRSSHLTPILRSHQPSQFLQRMHFQLSGYLVTSCSWGDKRPRGVSLSPVFAPSAPLPVLSCGWCFAHRQIILSIEHSARC